LQVIEVDAGEHAGYLVDLLSAQSELLSSVSVHTQWQSEGTTVRVQWRNDCKIHLRQVSRWVPDAGVTTPGGDYPPERTLEGEGRSLVGLCLAAALARVIRERVAVGFMASIVEGIGFALAARDRAVILDEAIRQAYAGEMCEEYLVSSDEQFESELQACLYCSDRGSASGVIRVDHVFIALCEYLRTSDRLSIEGFLRFRLKGYLARLRYAVYRAIDKFLLDQQRTEFIELLRYFAEIQRPRTESVTVVRSVEGYLRFYDAVGGLIDTDGLLEGVDDLVDGDVSAEDVLIGLLIAVAPARVLICMRGGRLLFENTISVFRGRIVICDGCSCCHLFDAGH
jgi:hypothetical protein